MEIKVDCFDIRQIADSGQCFRMKEHPTKKGHVHSGGRG